MSPPASDPMVGVLLDGRYRVERRLASGGMSRVYVGHDERLDRPVAIKVMNGDLASDPAFVARFTREARAAARILHPNIVTVYDQGADVAHDAVYLVMELVQGGTLRDLLHARESLPADEALAIIEPVLTGLAAAHAEGLVHRDIKPENILIDRQGRVLVADFGLARAVAESGLTTHSGRSGTMFGTIAYLSPEQVTKGYADARSDVYAIGTMLYEMLTGSPPYVADNAVSVAYRHVNDDVPPPSESTESIPGQVDDVVIAATTRDPLKRPGDAGDMLSLVSATRRELHITDVPVPIPPLPSAVAAPADAQPTSSTPGASETATHTPAAEQGAIDHEPSPDDVPTTAAPMVDGDTRGRDTLDHSDLDDESPLPGAPTRGLTPPDSTEPQIALPPDADDPASEAVAIKAPRRVRRRWLVPAIIAIVLALVAGTGFWWMQYGRWTEVPDFSQAQGADAISKLAQSADVNIVMEDAQFSETIGPGYPISFEPAASTRVTRGTSVHVTLSKGPERYFIDSSYVGAPSSAALAEIQADVGDRVTIQTQQAYSETVPLDGIVSFSPPAGTALQPGDTLVVTISQGRSPVPLPDVTGKTADEAMKMLTDAGFAPTVSPDQEFSDVPAGNVARTDPVPGTEVQPGAGLAVTIVISKGPDLVEVPDVTGKSTAEATSILEAAGFSVKVTTVFTTLGLVADQSPTGGTQAKRGSTVTIKVV